MVLNYTEQHHPVCIVQRGTELHRTAAPCLHCTAWYWITQNSSTLFALYSMVLNYTEQHQPVCAGRWSDGAATDVGQRSAGCGCSGWRPSPPSVFEPWLCLWPSAMTAGRYAQCLHTTHSIQSRNAQCLHTTHSIQPRNAQCLYTTHSIQPRNAQCLYTTHSIQPWNAQCMYTTHSIQPRNAQCMYTTHSIQPRNAQCMYTTHSIQPWYAVSAHNSLHSAATACRVTSKIPTLYKQWVRYPQAWSEICTCNG